MQNKSSVYIGIDYGKKKSGVSISDNNKVISFPLITTETSSLLSYINDLSLKENIEKIIIGKPIKLNNDIHDIEYSILEFIENLKNLHPKIEIKRVDERFTSSISKQIILDSGINKKKRANKFTIDKISASLILESYLKTKSND
ncbi:MAG: Holliday junction resolvase RuvX [Bacteroidota bacterium]